MKLDIVPFAPEHLAEAAELLAARHAAAREREPLLPELYASAPAARTLIESAVENARGLAAMREGRLAGYLIGVEAPPHDPIRRATVSGEGHAAVREGGIEIYRELYAAMAPAWLKRGCFLHQVNVGWHDQCAREAWFGLGFGQTIAYAYRDVSPASSEVASVEVRRAGKADFETCFRLGLALGRYNATSPMFEPYLWDPGPWRKDLETAIESDGHAFFLAYAEARPVGLMIMAPATALPPLVRPENSAFLDLAFVEMDARAGGVGNALLERCLVWARERGYEVCALDYLTSNILGARFWLGKGFRPVSVRLERSIDPRIAWADGSNE